jgi:hypothetical protein
MKANLGDPRLFKDYSDAEVQNPDIFADETTEDRDIFYGLWLKYTSDSDLDLLRFPDYFLLRDRYPKEIRFLILALYRRIDEDKTLELFPNSSTASDLLKQIEQISHGRDPLFSPVASDLLALVKFSWDGEQGELDAFATRTGLVTRDPQQAFATLDHLERVTLLWGHDKTLGRKPLGDRAPKAKAPTEMSYEELLSAYGKGTPKSYEPTLPFAVGDLISHPTFGKGVVSQCLPGKVAILFPSGKKILKARNATEFS